MILKIKNLTKKFGQLTALDNLCLEIGEGEIYALIGPNGAGKTTTIKILAGLYLPSGGTVEFLRQKRKNEILDKFLKIFPLREALLESPENYSRGNKQKLAICAAFLPEPNIVS